MANVTVSQLKLGDQLAENVLTKRGNLLFEKGKPITQRELEILKSFFIPIVSIEPRGTGEADKPSDQELIIEDDQS